MKTRDLLNMLDAEINKADERLHAALKVEDYEEVLKQNYYERAFLRVQLWTLVQMGRRK